LEEKDLMWRQRAKENWLKLGDRNSKYFHACANLKQRRSQILRIMDMQGRLCTEKEEIEKPFIDYFQDLFTTCTNLEVEECTKALEQKVTQEMNDILVAEFSVEEIYTALNQMPPLKAQAPMVS
jgi:hypothetical protein